MLLVAVEAAGEVEREGTYVLYVCMYVCMYVCTYIQYIHSQGALGWAFWHFQGPVVLRMLNWL